MNYYLEKIVPEEPYYELYIDADSNDGDYISEKAAYGPEQLEWLLEVYQIICKKLMGPHALHEMDEILTEEELDFLEYVDFPTSDYGICHTIHDVSLKYYDTDGSVYNVVLY